MVKGDCSPKRTGRPPLSSAPSGESESSRSPPQARSAPPPRKSLPTAPPCSAAGPQATPTPTASPARSQPSRQTARRLGASIHPIESEFFLFIPDCSGTDCPASRTSQ